MTEPIINILRLIFIGTATTIVRIIGQLAIPTGEQTVLSPSIFAQNGTMPVAFTIYGIFAYSLIAALFLLIRKRTGGNRIWQGLRYGFACCAVWIVYLWEPLPHVAPLDRITYPVADGLALIVMGLLLGWLFGQTRLPVKKRSRKLPALPGLIITLCFIAGRLLLYCVIGIYSSFPEKTVETLLWCLLAGFVIACAMTWLNRYVDGNSRIKRSLILGALLLVMGVEFVKLLALHTADAVVDVLLFTIVRQMIVSHTDAVETLLGVAAVAGIFAVKKFLQTREDAEKDRR